MADSARLRIGDLQKVKNELWDARTKWKDFGLALSMSINTLDSIATTQRDDPSNCLREMLADWLRGAGNPPRTWNTILAALKTVDGLGALAEVIESKFNLDSQESVATTRANSSQASAPPPPPNMKQLTKWNVIPKVAAKWRGLSDLLGIKPGVTASLEGKHHGDPELACREVFTRWLDGEGLGPGEKLTWDELLEALETLQFNVFVGELKEKLGR